MRRTLFALLVISGGLVVTPASAVDHELSLLNSVGRYLGVGWSHHSDHSNVRGRLIALNRRNPATDGQNRSLYPPHPENFAHYPVSGFKHIPSAHYLSPPRTVGMGNDSIIGSSPATEIVPSAGELESPLANDSMIDQSTPSVAHSSDSSSSRLNASLPEPTQLPTSTSGPVLESSTEIESEEINSDFGQIQLAPSPSDQSRSPGKSSQSINRNRYIYR